MAVFFYNTVFAAYDFFLGLAINYYLSIHTSLNLGKPHIERSSLIGNINYTTAFLAEPFESLSVVLHTKMFKDFYFVAKDR